MRLPDPPSALSFYKIETLNLRGKIKDNLQAIAILNALHENQFVTDFAIDLKAQQGGELREALREVIVKNKTILKMDLTLKFSDFDFLFGLSENTTMKSLKIVNIKP